MLIGGLEGLAHEFAYVNEPRRTLPDFKYLVKGARSDDDNDFEWMHVYFMDKENTLKLPYGEVVKIWKANINSGFWAANKRARELMNKGMEPPQTGSPKNNQYSWYNLSGQFCVEAYGMISPGMPQSAGDIGLHYAHITVHGEPLQATQYWTALISLVAVDDRPLNELLTVALAATDPKSAMAEVVKDAVKAHADHGVDWRAARQAVHQKWKRERGWNGNSTPLNGGLVVLALLYGDGDFHKTLQYAMALGEDADCNAATAGAVIGAKVGFEKIASLPKFAMPDTYENRSRPQLPKTSKVSEQAETLMRLAEKVIIDGGGSKITIDGKPGFRIVLQEPKLLEPLPADALTPATTQEDK
jgi:hypothetical protein